MKNLISRFMIGLGLTLFCLPPAFSADYYFYVENNSDSKIKHLIVSADGKDWGHFDIGSGIAPGKSVRIDWDESTNNLPCEHFLAAGFADNTISEPVEFDFCQGMDDPIVFE